MKNDTGSINPNILSVSDRIKALNEPLEEDYEKAAAAISHERKTRQAIPCAPLHKLHEILPLLTADRLRNIYQSHFLRPGPSKMKKQQLIDRLLKELPKPDDLLSFITIQPDMQWQFLREVLEAGEDLKDEQYSLEWASLALSQGYVFLFHHRDEFFWVTPDEVKAAFREIDNIDLRQCMEIRSWLNEFACAAMNLYGILPLDDFASLVNEHSKAAEQDKLNADLIEYNLRGYDVFEYDYRIRGGYLAAIDFTDDEDDDILDLAAVSGFLRMRDGKPQYIPDMKTFMRYADPDYYEVTPQVKLLRKALCTMGLSADKAEEVTDVLHEKIAAEQDFSGIMKALDECNVTLKADRAESIIQLITDMHNNTRIWSNFGHTSRETGSAMDSQAPRGVHLSANTVDLIQNDKLNIEMIKQGLHGTPFDNPDFKASLMSEITRAKAMKDGGEIQAEGSVEPLRKPGRNDPCPCGSGLKYKKCCGKNE